MKRIVYPILFIAMLMLLSRISEPEPEKQTKCKYTGMDKIEYGLWVTNCGDTIRTREAQEFNKMYRDKFKND